MTIHYYWPEGGSTLPGAPGPHSVPGPPAPPAPQPPGTPPPQPPGVPQPSTIEAEVEAARAENVAEVESGSILSVNQSGDKFLVRSQLPSSGEGVYRSTLMTEQQVIDRGGEIPLAGIWGQGAGTKWAPAETPTHQSVQRDKEKYLESLKDKWGMTTQSLDVTIADYRDKPKSPEWDTLSFEDRAVLAKLADVPFDAQAEFGRIYTRVGIDTKGEPEYILTSALNKLKDESPNMHEVLLRKGTKAYEAAAGQSLKLQEFKQEQNIKAFEAELSKAPQVLQDAYNKAGGGNKGLKAYNKAADKYNAENLDKLRTDDPYLYTVLTADGYDAYESAINKRNDTLSELSTRQINALRKNDPYLWDILVNQGRDEYEDAIEKRNESLGGIYERQLERQALYESAEATLAPYKDDKGNYDLVGYLQATTRIGAEDVDLYAGPGGGERFRKMDKERQAIIDGRTQVLRDAGFSAKDVELAAEQAKLGKAQSMWRGLTPWDEFSGETATIGAASMMAAELIVPGLYVARRWNELSAVERAVYITVDVASIIPFFGAAARGGRAAATLGRGAMITSAGKAMLKEGVAMARAPVDLIIHPIGAAKSSLKQVREVAENLLHPHKLPEFVITTTEGTVRLRVTKDLDQATAMGYRDTLMELAARGERPLIEIDGQVIELARSPLMKELEGGLTHATPMGEAFEEGIKVAGKPGKSLSEQGLFLSHEPLPRFAEASAFGKTGEKSVFIIVSPETAQRAVTSGKIYKSPFGNVAEMEKKFAVGFEKEVKWQKLFTRIGANGQRVEIWLEKPLKASQIAKLKTQGLAELLKAPFTPAIKVSGKGGLSGLTKAEVDELAGVLRASGNIGQADNLLAAQRVARSMRPAPRAMSRVVGRVNESARARARNASRARGMRRVPRAAKGRRAFNAIRREGLTRAERLLIQPRYERIRGTDRLKRTIRVERAPRRPGRPERVPRPERAERAERPERVTRPERVPELRIPPTDTPPPRIPLPGATDKQKRKVIRDSEDAIGWRHGELHGKDVFHVGVYPYDQQENWFTVIGRKPQGAQIVKGPGSAKQSIRLLRGNSPTKTVNGDIGFFDFSISPKTKRSIGLEFVPDPKGKTTGDVRIGTSGRTPPITDQQQPLTKRLPPITDRRSRISGKRLPSITPKRPKLQR